MADYRKMKISPPQKTVERRSDRVSFPRRVAHRLGLNNRPGLKRFYCLAVRIFVQCYLNRLNVPIIAVTGTNGKTTTTRLMEKILRDAGYVVGACTTEGVTHDGHLVWAQDAGGVYGALKAAQCPKVDVLVLEAARGGMLQYGLGFSKCQVGIVTNVYEDHLGFDGVNTLEQMARVKALVARRVEKKGVVVLNAEDAHVRRMAITSPAAPIYFTTGNDDKRFENLFFRRGNRIYKRTGRTETVVINATDVAVTHGGLLTYNIANVMAALAGIEGLQQRLPVKAEHIRKSLMVFGAEAKDNFNRFCMLTFRRERVILNYSKNPESCRRDMEAIQRIKENEKFNHVVGILSGVGNRQEKYFQEMSTIAAATCDYFFVRPPKPKYLRGRTGEEIVRLVASCIPEDRIFSRCQSGLPEVIQLSRKKLAGKILFVVFYIILEEKINFFEIVKEAE